MKKICFLAMMLAASVMTLTFSACGGDDDDGNGNKYSLPSSMMGTWSGKEMSDSYNYLILTLFSNGTSNVIRLQNGETKTEERGGKWAYNSSEETLVVNTSNGKAFHYAVSNFTGTSMTLQTNTTLGNVWIYNMTLSSSGSGDDDGGSGSGNDTSKCQKCGGTGKCSNHRSSDNLKLYCQGSGICKPCGGRGQVKNPLTGNYIICTYCNKKINKDFGNGECGFCGGSGNCSSCGGKGYK